MTDRLKQNLRNKIYEKKHWATGQEQREKLDKLSKELEDEEIGTEEEFDKFYDKILRV